MIWNHKYDFSLKWRERKFNYHFITSIWDGKIQSLRYRNFLVCANMLLIQWWAGCEKLQMLFLFSCNVIGFFKQALWKVHVWDNFRWEFLKAQNRISDTPFYSCILRWKVFDLEWGWEWPCCDKDQCLDSMIAGTTCCNYSFKVNWGISNQSEYAQHIA